MALGNLRRRIIVYGLLACVSIIFYTHVNNIEHSLYPEFALESVGLKSPLIEKVPQGNPAPCDAEHFPCDLSSIFPDPLSPEIAWDHKYSKDMTIPRGLGYYHYKPPDQDFPRAEHADPKILGQLGPSTSNVLPYVEGDAIPHNVRYYPDEEPLSFDSTSITKYAPGPAANREADDFIPLSLGYYTSEVPLRLDDTDGFDPSLQAYMRDSSFYGDAYRAAYPFDPENRPKFYQSAAAR